MQKAKIYLCTLLTVILAYGSSIAQTDSSKRAIVTNAFNIEPASTAIDTTALQKSATPLQLDTFYTIKQIIFEGDAITRHAVMLRELPFAAGDTVEIKQLPHLFAEATRMLMNTTLFYNVDVSKDSVAQQDMYIRIKVRERWYIWAFPHFKPVDRNINQWLFEKGANLGRVDYGVKLFYDNVTGNNDKLRFYFVTGYTRQLLLGYSRPYIDKAMRWGINVNMAWGKNREILYNTIADKQAFVKNGIYMKHFFNASVELLYRKALFTRHKFGIGYRSLRVADTVLQLNPQYFLHGEDYVRYPEMYYVLNYQNLDYAPYPTKGYAAELMLLKSGLNSKMNLWQVGVKGIGYWHLGKKYFYSILAGGVLKAPFRQPYMNQSFLGYGDMLLSGYEYYVIDGVAGGMAKATLSRQLINFSLNVPFLKRFTERLIPLKVYGKVYGNTGYAYNPTPGYNQLSNRMLFGGGFGLDIYTTNDITLKLEFSFNQLGQNGLFLHKKELF